MQRWFVRDLDIALEPHRRDGAGAADELIGQRLRAAHPQFFNRMLQDERLYAVGLCLGGERRPIATAQLSARARLRRARDATTAQPQRCCASGNGRAARRGAPIDADGAPHGLARARPRHELRRAAQRGDAALPVLFLRRARRVASRSSPSSSRSSPGAAGCAGLRALLRGEGILRPAVGAHRAGAAADRARPARAHPRPRAPVPPARRQPAHLGPGGAARDAAQRAARQRRHRRCPTASRTSTCAPTEGIRVQRPASGLVTALEPVMRACSGTWIAHGSGSRRPRDRRPPRPRRRAAGAPALPDPAHLAHARRRSDGYYDGFANEGLWPLCHIAHVRPTFRASDWEQYRAVNAKFADAVVAEAKTTDPVVLVQDYHFALLPRMIRERLPDATIITFWHIPWPNPEAFAICPWRAELLDGLLGSSILGFHTQFHCNNFLDTVDRLLEARVDRESFTISFRGESTAVHRYPISIEWPPAPLATRQAACPRRGAPCASGSACRRPPARRRRRPPRLHEGHRRALQRGRAPARARAALDRPLHVRPDRGAVARRRSTTTATTRRACARSPPRSTRASGREASADHPARRASRAGRGLRVSPRRRPLLRQQPARRHEPRRQGIRRRARRRAGRADPVAVRRRVARAARGAHRQSVRRRPVRGGAAPRADDAGRRAARPDAPHARRRARVQRLPLGGTDAARRGGDAPARAVRAADDGHGRHG